MYAPETPRILIIDSHGQPVRWALLARAARYHASGKVVTELGENLFSMTGGLQDDTGLRSEFITSSIVMIRGRHRVPYGHVHVGLTKHRLFARDRQVCAYCGGHFVEADLTVEHILPVSRGGFTCGPTSSRPAVRATRARATAVPRKRTCRCCTCPTRCAATKASS